MEGVYKPFINADRNKDVRYAMNAFVTVYDVYDYHSTGLSWLMPYGTVYWTQTTWMERVLSTSAPADMLKHLDSEGVDSEDIPVIRLGRQPPP